jgi:hypothetical protein
MEWYQVRGRSEYVRYRWIALALGLASALLFTPLVVHGQTRADSAAVLLEAARRFQAQDRADIADALFAMILQRFGDTAAAEQVRQLRAAAASAGSRAGRVELQVFSTMYGLWLGVATPLMFGADDPEPYGAGLLLGGPIGFLAGRAYTRSRPLSEGQARAITLAGTWGTWQGFGWANALDWGVRTETICPFVPPCFENETRDNEEELAAAAVAGGLAGILIGALISKKEITAGLASTVNYGSLWGTWVGFALASIADQEDDDLLTSTLIGGDVGLLATMVLGPGWRYSRPRARLISLGGVVGGLAGAGIDLLVQPDKDEVVFGIPLATSIAGLLFGAYATRNHDNPDVRPPGPGALLQIEGKAVTVDMPVPYPTFVVDRRGRRAVPAVGVMLVSARF